MLFGFRCAALDPVHPVCPLTETSRGGSGHHGLVSGLDPLAQCAHWKHQDGQRFGSLSPYRDRESTSWNRADSSLQRS